MKRMYSRQTIRSRNLLRCNDEVEVAINSSFAARILYANNPRASARKTTGADASYAIYGDANRDKVAIAARSWTSSNRGKVYRGLRR